MALFKCEACGAALEVQEDSKIAFCPYCGMKQTLPQDSVQVLSDGSTTESLLKRGFMLLEEEDYKAAGKCFNRVLNIDPENGRANLGRLMAFVKASDEYDLEWQLKHKDEEPDKWEILGKADKLLDRALEFAPEVFREMFEDEHDKALRLMDVGNYEAALVILDDITQYYPQARLDADKCLHELKTTREALTAYELEEHKRAREKRLKAGDKATDLQLERFDGYGAEDGTEELRRAKEEIFSVVDLYIESFEIVKKTSVLIKTDARQYGIDYYQFAFDVKNIDDYLTHSYIDDVKADNETKKKFLEDIYAKMTEAYKYLEANDTYNKEGSYGYKYRKELLRSLKEYERSRNHFFPEHSSTSRRKPQPKQSSSKYFMSIFISAAFLIWLLITAFKH